jgi:hypothetical protein
MPPHTDGVFTKRETTMYNERWANSVGRPLLKLWCQLSEIVYTSAARFSSVSGPEIWREWSEVKRLPLLILNSISLFQFIIVFFNLGWCVFEKSCCIVCFESVIEKVSKFTLYSVCCETHQRVTIPFLVYEYIVLRFHFQAYWEKNEMDVAKKSSKQHKSRKLSKLWKIVIFIAFCLLLHFKSEKNNQELTIIMKKNYKLAWS